MSKNGNSVRVTREALESFCVEAMCGARLDRPELQQFRYMESGGHYGVLDQAGEYAKELRGIFRPIRTFV